MKRLNSTAALAVLCLILGGRLSNAADDATLLRVFLRDGTSLVSYGEFARVSDRVIFSLPTESTPNPPLQLVNIPADRVDWDRTSRYAESARTARYVATRAEDDYVGLSNAVARALNEVTFATDSTRRLEIAEGARKMLAEWPANHFHYRQAEVRQMVSMLDEAIADLRAAGSGGRFNLSLVALAEPPLSNEPLLPPPTPMEAIEQLLSASKLAESSVERRSLLGAVLVSLDRHAASLPAEWTAATRSRISAAIDEDVRVDRTYQLMIQRLLRQATQRARLADVRGVGRTLQILRQNDLTLGRKRPDAVGGAVAAVEAQLDAARRLRLARDRWALRAPLLREYSEAMTTPLVVLRSLQGPLGDIKELAGSSRASLALVQSQVNRILDLVGPIEPPEECRGGHALLVSAVHLAANAAAIRREATLAGDVTRAWDASSAAAGALMLSARAIMDIKTSLRPPQLQ